MADYEYDDLGRRTRLSKTFFGSDVNTVYEYDLADRLIKLTNNIDDSNITFEYADYDKVGNRLSCKANYNDVNERYTYDELYRLTFVERPGDGNTAFAYDSLGNRTEVNDRGDIATYVHNSLNQYSSVGGESFTYDDNGNLTNDGFYKYYYDCENRLTDVNYVSNNKRVAQYKYDWLGRRVRKIVYDSSEEIEKDISYCYDGDQVLDEYDENDTLLRRFVYGAGIDEPVAMLASGQGWFFYHYDGLGSVVAMSNANEEIVEECSYDVFGEPSCISDIGNPYMFTARRLDEETGLYYYRARMYSPELGRFLQPDPLGYFDSMNLYQYCLNNPANLVDPTGEWIIWVIPVFTITAVIILAYHWHKMEKQGDKNSKKMCKYNNTDLSDDAMWDMAGNLNNDRSGALGDSAGDIGDVTGDAAGSYGF